MGKGLDGMAVAEEVWREYSRSKDKKIKQELVLDHLPLVKYIAGRLAVKLPPAVDREDLESYGIFGLLEAVEKYNPDLGVNFKTYAGSRIRGAMIDEIRKLNWLPRTTWQKIQQVNSTREKLQGEYGKQVTNEVLARALGISLAELYKLAGQTCALSMVSLDETLGMSGGEEVRRGNLIRDPDSPDPLDVLMKEEGREILVRALNGLSERDRTVLALYYQEGLTLKEIGRVLEVSESRVCQLHTRALERVRDRLELPAGAKKKTATKGGK